MNTQKAALRKNMREDIEGRKREIAEREEVHKRMRALLELLPSNLPEYVRLSEYDTARLLLVHEGGTVGLEGVKQMRSLLRSSFLDWEDELVSVFPYGDWVDVTYASTSRPVCFTVTFAREGFEETGILKEGCRIVEKTSESSSYLTVECAA